MKLIIAMIQPYKLPDVKMALDHAEIRKMTVFNVLGAGQQGGYTENFRGAKLETNLLKKVAVLIGVNDAYVKPTVEAIVKGARTGKIGDGKIFILDLEECLRIRTGEAGPVAIG